ncbi:hypothetical protein HZB88_00180 [archaeon]|nr:hypothetical protein [archaeon]
MDPIVNSPYALSAEEKEKAKIALAELADREINSSLTLLINYQLGNALQKEYAGLKDMLSLYIGLQKKEASTLQAAREQYSGELTGQELEKIVESSANNLKEILEEWIIDDLTADVMSNEDYELSIRQIICALYKIDSDENARFHAHVSAGLYSAEEQEPLKVINSFRKAKIEEWEQLTESN